MVRQSCHKEKFLVLVKVRPGHDCEFSCQAVGIVQYSGVPRALADQAYSTISQTVARDATQTERGCMANSTKTCACQGEVEGGEGGGRSCTFGCSWNMYTGGLCKFAKSSGEPRKFKLNNSQEEAGLEQICGQLADCVSSEFQRLAPACFTNMTLFSQLAPDCRIGSGSEEGGQGRPLVESSWSLTSAPTNITTTTT